MKEGNWKMSDFDFELDEDKQKADEREMKDFKRSCEGNEMSAYYKGIENFFVLWCAARKPERGVSDMFWRGSYDYQFLCAAEAYGSFLRLQRRSYDEHKKQLEDGGWTDGD